MLDLVNDDQTTRSSGHPAPACVLAVDPDLRCVQVQPSGGGSDTRLWCRMAAPGLERLRAGDEVLVVGDAEHGAYVIGALSAGEPEAAPVAGEARLSGGARAVAVEDTRLQVLDARGGLLFEYDAAAGRAVLHAPPGGLEISGGAGDLALTTDGDLRLAAQTVHVDGRLGVRLAVADHLGRVVSGMRLGHRGAHLFGASLEVLAGRARLVLREVVYQGERLEATLERLKLAAESVETAVETVVSRARNVYQTVRELCQLRTGRQRTVVDEGAHLHAGKLELRARADVSIDGERIHLG